MPYVIVGIVAGQSRATAHIQAVQLQPGQGKTNGPAHGSEKVLNILTVTDKDGGVWSSLDSVDECFFAFATGPALPPPSEPASYSAAFTAITATNLVFEVRVVSGDPAPGELIAPGWCLHKRPVFTALHHCLRERRWWQGCQADVPDARPEWYGARADASKF